jgi:hypothetical protein
MVEEESDELKRYRLGSVLTLQWYLIGRIDDMMILKVDCISPNINQPDTASSKIEWSKKITEETESAEQIIIGANDPTLCPQIAIGVYFELLGHFDASHIQPTYFLLGDAVNGDHLAHNQLDSVWSNTKFNKSKHVKLGTHVVPKEAPTYASHCGLLRDYVKYRGRWRARKQVVDPTLPYPDSKVAIFQGRHDVMWPCRSLQVPIEGWSGGPIWYLPPQYGSPDNQ